MDWDTLIARIIRGRTPLHHNTIRAIRKLRKFGYSVAALAKQWNLPVETIRVIR